MDLNFYKTSLIVFSGFILCFSTQAVAQTSDYRYWIPFVDTVHSGANDTHNNITIYAFKDCTQASIGSQDFSLDAGELLTIERPTLKEGLLIHSNNPLQIQYFFAASHYSIYEDGALSYYVLEEQYLGKAYTVPIPNIEIAVVATENNTQFTIGAEPPEFLNAGESKRYPSIPIGTPISSDKPIAVAVVHYSEDFYSATYAEMILPHHFLSNVYYVPKQKSYTLNAATDSSGVYLTSISDNTSVEASGGIYHLNKGESVFLLSTEGTTVRSNHPVYAIYLNDVHAQDPWTDEFRHYQYAFSLSSPDLGIKNAIIDKATTSSHGFPVVQISITSFKDDNQIFLSTNNNTQQTLQLNTGETVYLNERDISGWESYPLMIASEQEIQVTNSVGHFWLRISETTYAGNVFGATFSMEESEELEITASGPTTFCEGDSVTLSVPTESGTSFQWFQNGSPVGTDSSALVVADSGEYTVQVLDPCGETRQSDTVYVSVRPIPIPPVVKDTARCDPGPVTLTASGANDGHYRWYTQDSIPLNGQTNAVFQTPALNATTTYLVSIVEDSCESELVPVQAMILEPPQADAGEDVTIDPGEEVQLQAWGGMTYQWLPEEGLSDPSIPNPMASPGQTTTYEVTVTTGDGCSDTDEVTVQVADVVDSTSAEGLSIPNVFTPNGDGVNDQWNIEHIDQYPDCQVKIYDRWGLEIFSSTGYLEAWDGSFRGRLLPGDVYFYVIDLRSDTHPGTLSGYVTLIR